MGDTKLIEHTKLNKRRKHVATRGEPAPLSADEWAALKVAKKCRRAAGEPINFGRLLSFLEDLLPTSEELERAPKWVQHVHEVFEGQSPQDRRTLLAYSLLHLCKRGDCKLFTANGDAAALRGPEDGDDLADDVSVTVEEHAMEYV